MAVFTLAMLGVRRLPRRPGRRTGVAARAPSAREAASWWRAGMPAGAARAAGDHRPGDRRAGAVPTGPRRRARRARARPPASRWHADLARRPPARRLGGPARAVGAPLAAGQHVRVRRRRRDVHRALAFCVWSTRRDLRWLGLFVIAPVLLTLGLAITVWYTEAAELMPSLKSYWLAIHVTVATLSVALFTIGASASRSSTSSRDALAALRAGAPSSTGFPPRRALERAGLRLHIVAFPLWTFTLIAGAIWARQAWGSYWNWDPKEVWTFVIWVVYAAYLHARATSGWQPPGDEYIALAGWACIIINYTVVNVFFVGQHSYSGL